MKRFQLVLTGLVFMLIVPVSQAQEFWVHDRPDAHAPIGVVEGQSYLAGEWTASYRYGYLRMLDNLDGTDVVAVQEVLDDFEVAPVERLVHTHLMSVAYAPTDRLTLRGMVNVTGMTGDHLTREGDEFTVESVGIGDTRISAFYVVQRFVRQHVRGGLGVSIPSGSITQRDATPIGDPDDVQLPYPLQLGSGTYDLLPSITYLGQTENWSWGGQMSGAVRLGENERGYRLGNRVTTTFWGSRMITESFSVSTRAEGEAWGDVEGGDEAHEDARWTPEVVEELQSGTRIEVGLGINYHLAEGMLSGLRLAVEGLAPVYQSLEGPQLATDFSVVVGVQYTFEP